MAEYLANYTILDTVTVQPGYMRNAIIVLCSTIPSFIPNSFILYVCFKKGMITGQFKASIAIMTICNLYSALYAVLFHLFYIFVNFTNTPVDFYLCSFLRRFAITSNCPSIYGCLIVAIDRFFVVCLNRPFPLMYHLILQIPLLTMPVWILITHMTSTKITMEDICGPTLKTELKDIPTWFLFKHARKMTAMGIRNDENEVSSKKKMTVGMIFQCLLPICTQLPMAGTALFYWRGVFVPQLVWDCNNVVFYIGLTLNPVITVIFVRQFRQAALKILTMSYLKTKVTTIQPSQLSTQRLQLQ
ncbi:hypothetical protein L596_019602 [Steinernema carpocapsae]|uniref:G-protein coupled receptors family 1 profile domain-containing protein n=1 Tax=Steinernema carpocapsae TaxID=34508 RepID=A0A4U5MR00_STECR|nr:hypothetical protein L596_019602 [Steinernema carpocapsae]